ncbi:MAG TPA: hypothetical protein VIR56_05615 [Solimonas sp.]
MTRAISPKDFGRVAVLAGGWVSDCAYEVPVALRAVANARPWMAGPGHDRVMVFRHGRPQRTVEGVAA